MKHLAYLSIVILTINSPYLHSQSVIPPNKGIEEARKLNRMAHEQYKKGQFKKAAQLYVQVTQVMQNRVTNTFYNAACSWALCGQTDSAFKYLDIAVYELGYHNYQHISTDRDLTSLHKSDKWQEILSEVKLNAERKKEIKKRLSFENIKNRVIFSPLTNRAKKYIYNRTMPFLSINHGNFRVFFSGSSHSARNIEEFISHLDYAFFRCLNILGVESYNRGINIILVESPEEITKLTGSKSVSGAYGGQGHMYDELLVLNHNPTRKLELKHELFHIMSHWTWGKMHRTARILNEGGAQNSDNDCLYENPIYTYAAVALKEKTLYPIDTLIYEFPHLDELKSYMQGAGIFKFLRETYGVEKMRKLWINGFSNFDKIYGMNLTQFDKKWRDFIQTIPIPENATWGEYKEKACGYRISAN